MSFARLLEIFVSLLTRAAIIFVSVSALILLGVAVLILSRSFIGPVFALEEVLLAIALAVITVGVGDLALTISREESVRQNDPSNPVITTDLVTRFLFVVVTTLSIGNLFTVVRAEVQGDPQRLLVSGGLVVSTAILTLATAFFYRETHPWARQEREQPTDNTNTRQGPADE